MIPLELTEIIFPTSNGIHPVRDRGHVLKKENYKMSKNFKKINLAVSGIDHESL